MKHLLLILALLITAPAITCRAQNKPTVSQVATFPEDYLGEVLTFLNIRWYPTLTSKDDGIYRVKLDRDKSVTGGAFVMGALDKIQSVVSKDICKQIINDDIGGYSMWYWGNVTGKVVEVEDLYADYYFQITKIVSFSWDGKVFATYE